MGRLGESTGWGVRMMTFTVPRTSAALSEAPCRYQVFLLSPVDRMNVTPILQTRDSELQGGFKPGQVTRDAGSLFSSYLLVLGKAGLQSGLGCGLSSVQLLRDIFVSL